MSIPAEKAATQQNEGKTTFAEAVNKAVEAATVDAKGNLVLPEDLPDEVAYAATLEKRRRDTQAAFTKTNKQLKALELEKAVLLDEVTGEVRLELTEEQATELEELKFSDPEAWRKKVNALEIDAKKKKRVAVDDKVKQASTSSLDKEELERRKQVLEEFNQANPDFLINDDVIANDIPPRITSKLAKGDITFEEFLQECLEYTKTGKVVKQEGITKQPNLSKVAGGNKPDDNSVKEDIIKSYKNETY